MSRKVRRQVTLDAEQDAALRQKARELGISEAEVIRRGIALVCNGAGKEDGLPPGMGQAQASKAGEAVGERGRVLTSEEQRQWKAREEKFFAETKAMIAEKLRQNPDDRERARRLMSLEETLKFAHERFDPSAPQTGRGWTREDIYEEMYEQRFARLFG